MADDDAIQAYREFTTQLILRFERLTRELRADTQAARAESRAYFERIDARLAEQRAETRAYFERFDRDHAEQWAEMRAMRQALFRILDRLDGNGGAAPATG